MKKALVIGIDNYPGRRLQCCVQDATDVAAMLRNHGGESPTELGAPNFDVTLMTSANGSDVTNWGIEQAISEFFASSTRVETAVLYFAGHGVINPKTDTGYIVGIDGRQGAHGMRLSEVLALANQAAAIESSVIILDCCHAGHMGASPGASTGAASAVGKGVTILTSCNEDQKSIEAGEHGVFTELLLDALGGSCADVRGYITPAAVYTHIDQALGAHEQRPLYKVNAERFVTLRHVEPTIPPRVLRRISEHFPHSEMVYALSPSCERHRSAESLAEIPVDEKKANDFAELQMYNREGLVVPVGTKHMYFAAMESMGCKLTAMGKHYRRLAATNKLS